MPLETNLNVSPYFDDFNEEKDFYKILFRPGVALQARELTQLQTIVQNQIERFGNHIFKSGTIISGVNFEFNPRLDYVKIIDIQVDGQPVVPTGYESLFVRNSSNLVARVVASKTGFQSRDPEMSYLYLKYINTGESGNTRSYSNSDVLTVYSDTYRLFDFNVNNGGTSFSNSDSVQIVSALVVANSNIAAGAGVSQVIGSNTANVFVIESNNTFGSITVGNNTYANTDGYRILKIRPISNDLSNTLTTSAKWSISSGFSLVQGSNTATVTATIGTGASATLTTDGAGIITDVSLINSGAGYVIAPHVAVRSSTGTVSTADITAQNFKAQVTVADSSFTGGSANPVGTAYGFSVTEGVIYQKGYFLRVEPQSIVVNAYSSNVNSVTVGFNSVEAIVNSSADTSLLDLATGTPNFAAPGANRLSITPALNVINASNVASNSTFFPLVEFREGEPFRQNTTTAYNLIAKEWERRTTETSGDFVVDKFQITTKDQPTWSNTYVDLVVDPGLAYIEGRRVQSSDNYYVPLRRASNTKINSAEIISINYGNYIIVEELGGYFEFKSGASIDIYDTPRDFISSGLTTITTTGTKIGTANIRSLVLESGIPGLNAKYRLYLFNINMLPGKSFKSARSVHYNGATLKGIADIVLSIDSTTGLEAALINDVNSSSLAFNTGAIALRNANNVNYSYRTSNTGVSISVSGVIQIVSTDSFTYGNNAILNSVQRKDIIITPTANVTSTNTVTSVTATNSSNVVSATGLTARFLPGDTVRIQNPANTAQTLFSKVTLVTNSSTMSLSSAWTYATITGTGTAARHFPANTPIPLDDNRVAANTNSTGKTLTVNLSNTAGQVTFGGVTAAVATYNVRKVNELAVQKNISRGNLVKLDLSTHPASNSGPWCLGVPDAFRLNKVYLANSSVVNTNSTDVTRFFYIDNGQKNDYYGHSHLVPMNSARLSVSNTSWLLVEFDSFTLSSPTDAGYFSINSYDVDFSNSTRAQLGNTGINIIEIPEFRYSNGQYLDLRDSIDFRPRVSNTAAITSTLGSASVNPANTIAFNTSDKLFPVPDSDFNYTYEYFLPRVDRVVIDIDSNITVVEGSPGAEGVPGAPINTMSLGIITVPPYPSIPVIPDGNQINLGAKKTGVSGPINTRATSYKIRNTVGQALYNLQPRRYTMQDIGKLERRIDDLEYYTQLSLLEKKTSDLVIPSSIDPALNRFKNGFFVEQFQDYIQADTASSEFSSCIEQVNGTLHALEATQNYQARFNYSDSTTRNNLILEGVITEPGQAQFGEAVLTLPRIGEATIIQQDKLTSAVSADGTATIFAGDMIVAPNAFRITLNVEVRLTGDDAGPPPPPPPVADTGGGGGGCKIICAKLNELGFFEDDINAADQAFGAYLRDNHPEIFNGYLAWAQTVVDWMEGKGPHVMPWLSEEKFNKLGSELTIKYLNKLARPWAIEMAYMMGARKEGSLAGKIIMVFGLPLSWIIGKLGFKPVEKSSLLRGYSVWGICTVLLGVSVTAQLIESGYKKIKSLFKKQSLIGNK